MKVKWDHDDSTNSYRWGKSGKFDLLPCGTTDGTTDGTAQSKGPTKSGNETAEPATEARPPSVSIVSVSSQDSRKATTTTRPASPPWPWR